jgi:hypothetical protein
MIRQGDYINKDETSFCVLICDIEDIKQQYPNKTDKEIKIIYEYARRKLTDIIMPDFWLCVDSLEDNMS